MREYDLKITDQDIDTLLSWFGFLVGEWGEDSEDILLIEKIKEQVG